MGLFRYRPGYPRIWQSQQDAKEQPNNRIRSADCYVRLCAQNPKAMMDHEANRLCVPEAHYRLKRSHHSAASASTPHYRNRRYGAAAQKPIALGCKPSCQRPDSPCVSLENSRCPVCKSYRSAVLEGQEPPWWGKGPSSRSRSLHTPFVLNEGETVVIQLSTRGVIDTEHNKENFCAIQFCILS